MQNSIIPEVIEAVMAMLGDRQELQGVRVQFGPPASDDRPTEHIYFDDIDEWDVEYPVFSGGKPRVSRDEKATLPMIIEVRSKTDPFAAFCRAFEIYNEIGGAIAEDPQARRVAELVTAKVESGSVELTQVERKPKIKLTTNIVIHGRLRT